jgi:signal transduction histidine kinase
MPNRPQGDLKPDAGSIQEQLAALKQQQAVFFADMARNQVRYRQLARSVWRVQEDERRRFSRELHDGIGQNITAILHQLEQVATAPELSKITSDRVQRALALCALALQDTRHLARMLRPKVLDDLGLSAALQWLGRSISDSSGIGVEVVCEQDFADPSGELAALVFRVVQEALNNVAKHAKASDVLVNVGVRDDILNLLVADDGVGFDTESRQSISEQGSGLGGMRERVELFGGRLRIVSAPGEGTQLRVQLALTQASAEAHAIRS